LTASDNYDTFYKPCISLLIKTTICLDVDSVQKEMTLLGQSCLTFELESLRRIYFPQHIAVKRRMNCEHIVLFCCEVRLLIYLFITNRIKVNCLVAAGSSLYIQQVSSSYYRISPSPDITTRSPLGVFIMALAHF